MSEVQFKAVTIEQKYTVKFCLWAFGPDRGKHTRTEIVTTDKGMKGALELASALADKRIEYCYSAEEDRTSGDFPPVGSFADLN